MAREMTFSTIIAIVLMLLLLVVVVYLAFSAKSGISESLENVFGWVSNIVGGLL